MIKFMKKILCTAAVLLLSCSFLVQQPQAASKNSMTKVLKYYKNKKYTAAQKVANKLPKTAAEKSISKMSNEVKKAYLKKVKYYAQKRSSKSFIKMHGYYLTDIDKDGTPELLIEYGSCEADMRIFVYTYKNHGLKQLGTLAGGHTIYYAYPDGKGLIGYWCLQGYEAIGKITIKNQKLKSTSIGGRRYAVMKRGGYVLNGLPITLPYALNSHSSYNYRNDSYQFDYTDLTVS